MNDSRHGQNPPAPSQIPYYPPAPYYAEEDEISLLDYLIVLLKYKWLIFFMVVIAGATAVTVSLRLPNIYRSSATIVPRQQEKSGASSALAALGSLGGMAAELTGLGGGTDLDKIEVILKSRELARRVVEKYKIMPVLFTDIWDPQAKGWLEEPAPTIQDAYKAIQEALTVSRDRKTQVLTVSFDHQDPHFAKNMVDWYITELSELLREQTLKDARENKRFLEDQLRRTPDVLLREKIYNLLAREIEKETFALAQRYYGFNVLDPPVVSDLDKKVKPKRALICMLSVVVAGFFAVFLAFFLEYINNAKNNDDPERWERLRRYLRPFPGSD